MGRGRMSQLKHRLTVAAWGIPLITAVTLIGGGLFALITAFICFLGQKEYYRLAGMKEPVTGIAAVLGGLIPLTAHFCAHHLMVYLLIAFVIIILSPAFIRLENIQRRLSIALSGMIYPSLLLASIVLIRDADWGKGINGGIVIIFILSAVWICDTAAYFGGKKFGRNKLAPVLSPNKTIEGAVLGLIGGAAWAVIVSPMIQSLLSTGQILITALIIGTIGQLGDLSESALKRSAGVKDSGTFLPGHGGVLDRFDSLITAVPAIYVYYSLAGII